MATFEEFMDLDIRVGRVINAEDFLRRESLLTSSPLILVLWV